MGLSFPLVLDKGDSIELDVEDVPLTFQAQYRHVFPDIHALRKYAQDAAHLRYPGLIVTHPPDYAKSVAGALQFFAEVEQARHKAARLNQRLQRAYNRSTRHTKFMELRGAVEELFSLVRRERLMPAEREQQIRALLDAWRET
jgi:hypothetical protein